LHAHPSVPPAALGVRLPGEAARMLLARWLVDERDWLDVGTVVAEMRRRLERRHAQRRVRAITQTIAQSEAAGATTDYASLLIAQGRETPRIRADAGGTASWAPDRANSTPPPTPPGPATPTTPTTPTTEDARP
ncbi:MAG: hypothetical protein ACREJR_13775, partial [Candidatus Rokuibacteriota bacterium]